MEKSNRHGQVLIELVIMLTLFLGLLVIIDFKKGDLLKIVKKNRWETVHEKK